jgi:hypothetical protein
MTAAHTFLRRPSAPLPTERDFDPHIGDLDAQCAWKNFGGLSLKQAFELFITRPEIYQEDFMFMGCRAFDYYFPVVDRYLRETQRNEEDFGDCEASILGSCIVAQCRWEGSVLPDRLLTELDELIDFIMNNVDRYAATKGDRRRILRKWSSARDEVQKRKNANKAVHSTTTRVTLPAGRSAPGRKRATGSRG